APPSNSPWRYRAPAASRCETRAARRRRRVAEEKVERRLPLTRHGHRRQRRQENLAVAAARQSRIADCYGAEVLLAANETAHPLLQRQGGLRQLVLPKRAPACRLEVLDPRAHQRIVRRGER